MNVARERQWDVQFACAVENLAAISAVRQLEQSGIECDWHSNVARLMGFVEERFKVLGSPREPIVRPRYERVLDLLREALGAERVVQLMSLGASTTEEEAAAEALTI